MSERTTQRNLILQSLLNGERLTPLDALKRFGCMRLGGRVYDLKQEGYDVKKDHVKTKKGTYVAQYFLEAK